MPLYSFLNNKTGEIKDILMPMNALHEYRDESGYKWERVWYRPNAAIDTVCDPFDSKQFVEHTGKKCGNLGNITDYAKEMSLKREKIAGRDNIREKYYDEYSKKRGGKKIHPSKKKQLIRESMKNDKNFEIDLV